MFERKGFVQVSLDKNLANFDKSVEELIEAALGADAEDFDQQLDEENPENVSLKVRVLHLLCSRLAHSNVPQFTSAPEALSKVCEAVMSMSSNMQSLRLQTNELIYKPVEANESTEELELQVSDLVSDLEGDEDILRVWTSLDSR
jgi:transcriptional/translational regulatory protein YebC/TACO1